MRLSAPLGKLPVRFDVGRLTDEIRKLPSSAWLRHPKGTAGIRNLILISTGGAANDEFAAAGQMQATPALQESPYLQQVLGSFRAPICRARLSELAPGTFLAPHEDANFYWYRRVRIHIPVISNPSVSFRCDHFSAHMAPGDAWVFDNFRRHEVRNASREYRVHLIFDTVGSSTVASLLQAGLTRGIYAKPKFVAYQQEQERCDVPIEPYRFDVPSPREMTSLVKDVIADVDRTLKRHEAAAARSRLLAVVTKWRKSFRRATPIDGAASELQQLLDEVDAISNDFELKNKLDRYAVGYGSLAVLTTVFQLTNRTVSYTGEPLPQLHRRFDGTCVENSAPV